MFDYFWWNILVLGMGSFAIYWLATQKPQRFSMAFVVLFLSLCMGVVGYTRFGQMHGGRTYHYSEVWHYYLGSKYYKEVSQKYLYVSIVSAFEELKATTKVPHVQMIRDLEHPFEFYSAQKAKQIFEQEVRPRFTSERWVEFKADLARFLSACHWTEGDWMSLGDVGYNPPPSFSVVVGSIASLIKITPRTLTLIPFIDWSLVLIVAFIVFRTFGLLAMAGFLLIYCTNNLSGMYWIGGGFFRNEWLSSITIALCALDRRKYLLAGAAFGFAIAMRVFPFVFLFGACLPFLPDFFQNRQKGFQPIAQLIMGALLVLAPLILISFFKYPLSNWADFFAKIFLHSKTFFVMHLGYDKLAANTLNASPQYFGDPSSFENWNILMNDRFNEHWMFHRSIALLFVAGAIFASLRIEPKMASLLTGETALFFYALPANYYYIYLAAFGVVTIAALKEAASKGNSLRFWFLIGFLIVSNLVGGFSNDWIVLNWWINLALLCLLFVYIISQMVQKTFNWKEDKYSVFFTLICIVSLALITFKPREFPATNSNGLKTQILVFTPKDIESGRGWMQDLHSYDPHWPTKSHLLVNNTNGLISVGKSFVIPKSGRYQITIFHARASDYIKAKIRVSCIGFQEQPMSTWSPTLMFVQDTYNCDFAAGANSIRITGTGNAVNRFLGVNSIVLEPL